MYAEKESYGVHSFNYYALISFTFTTGLLELLKLFWFPWIVRATGDGKDEILRKNKRNPLSADSKLFLVMAQEVAKVYMENLALLIDHNIVRMPVPNTQDEGGHTVPRAQEEVKVSIACSNFPLLCSLIHKM